MEWCSYVLIGQHEQCVGIPELSVFLKIPSVIVESMVNSSRVDAPVNAPQVSRFHSHPYFAYSLQSELIGISFLPLHLKDRHYCKKNI